MLKRLLTAAILALLATAVHAAGLFPLSNTQQIDSNGKIMPGARLFLFNGGTSTPRIGYKDLALTTPHPNPILADSAGRLPLIFLDDGYYRQRLTSKSGTQIFDQDGIPVLTTSAGGAGTSVDPDSVFKTRDVKIRFDDQPLSGYVRLNGRTIGSASSGATERANADTQSLYEELWAFANISVTGGKGATAAADFAANKPLVLPDMAGRLIAGNGDQGAGDQGRLTTAVLGSDPTKPGAVGGAQTVTLAASNLPVTAPWVPGSVSVTGSGSTDSASAHVHNVPGSVATSGASNTHTHVVPLAEKNIQQGGGAAARVWAPDGGTAGTLISNADSPDHAHLSGATQTDAQGVHNHAVSITGTGSVSLGSNSGGGQATNKLPPLMTLMIFIRL